MTLAEHRRQYPGQTTLSSLLDTWDNLLAWADHFRDYGQPVLAEANYKAGRAMLYRVADGEGTP
jgi:hypothetical protein